MKEIRNMQMFSNLKNQRQHVRRQLALWDIDQKECQYRRLRSRNARRRSCELRTITVNDERFVTIAKEKYLRREAITIPVRQKFQNETKMQTIRKKMRRNNRKNNENVTSAVPPSLPKQFSVAPFEFSRMSLFFLMHEEYFHNEIREE